jgi:tryptophan-rich sensory protein
VHHVGFTILIYYDAWSTKHIIQNVYFPLVQSAHRSRRQGTNPGRDVRTIHLTNTCQQLWGSIHPPLKSIARAYSSHIKWRNLPLTSTQRRYLGCSLIPAGHNVNFAWFLSVTAKGLMAFLILLFLLCIIWETSLYNQLNAKFQCAILYLKRLISNMFWSCIGHQYV